MIIGVTGTQHGMTEIQKQALREVFEMEWLHCLHHGDCVGADAEAHLIAKAMGAYIVVHPPEKTTKRAYCTDFDEIRLPQPYMVRNANIVNETRVLIATPAEMNERKRSGTWSTVRKAVARGRRVVLVYPDGSVQEVKAERQTL